MERRVTSHTEEEEMNQRRRLLTLARKGEQKSIDLLFELYQVKVFSGDALKKKKLPSFPVLKSSKVSGKVRAKAAKTKEKPSKVSLSLSKVKKEQTKKPQSVPKGASKVKTKASTVTTSSQKAKKLTKSFPKAKKLTKASLKKTTAAKKISLPKKKPSGGRSKQKALGSAKKLRIAKKK
ncbi:MAG: hypothetical protein VST67_06750 [Nitrospirota bacterium]|nr:hypothetical protein [Nitrospirota bacterium]